ncbi:hypothetical protein [Paractinoplanes globisporus]|uniref:Uncharacterized protein n=1 Tax=Paractinoplanes globisporus TaxID=113565 RepID=A0ABW6WT62_9ACTN|nr:hypothetical protein [Actinoplanes globisporus]
MPTSPPIPASCRRSWWFIRWLHNFAPTGGGGGTAEAAYTNFMQGDCWATLELARVARAAEGVEPLEEPLRSTYEGAAAACLAAFHGRADLWGLAGRRHDRVTVSGLDCWDRSVYAILHQLVTAHRADPDATFAVAKGTASACPQLAEWTFPRQGPRTGGYSIEIRGRNLPMTLELLWNYDRVVTAKRAGPGRPMKVVVPAARSDDHDVTIKIANAPRDRGVAPVIALVRTLVWASASVVLGDPRRHWDVRRDL